MKKAVFIILIIISSGCGKDTDSFIDPVLAPYLTSFQEEAAIRGITIDFDDLGLEAYLVSMSSDGIKGQCLHHSDRAKTVNIDMDFWNTNDHYSREFLFFHELGHCVLGRSHLDDKDVAGHCISIMNSGSSACRARYTSGTREEFLDELFSVK